MRLPAYSFEVGRLAGWVAIAGVLIAASPIAVSAAQPGAVRSSDAVAAPSDVVSGPVAPGVGAPVVNAMNVAAVPFSVTRAGTVYAQGGNVTVSGEAASAGTVSLDLRSLPDGVVRVWAAVKSPCCEVASNPVFTRKDTSAPTILTTSPEDGATYSTLDHQLIVSLDEPGSVNAVVSDGTSSSTYIGGGASPLNDGSTTALPVWDDHVGTWTATLTASDGAGNTTTDVISWIDVSPAAAQAGQDCGTLPSGTTTWTATNGPHVICPAGLVVPVGAELNLDASAGSFSVVAAGEGGISMSGAAIVTSNTGPSNSITFDSADPSAGPGSWRGIASFSSQVALSYVTVSHAVTGISSTESNAALDHITVSASSQDGIDLSQGTLTNCVVDDAGAAGIAGGADISGCHVSNAHFEGIVNTGLIYNNVVDASGVAQPVRPAIEDCAPQSYEQPPGTVQMTGPTGLDTNSGGGNGLDAIAVCGDQSGGFTWVSPSNEPTEHPLGFLNLGLAASGAGTVVIPAGSVVKSALGAWDPKHTKDLGLDLSDQVTLAAGPGTVFTALADDSAGLVVSRSGISGSRFALPGAWAGITSEQPLVLTDTSVRYASDAVTTTSAVTVTGVTISMSQDGLRGPTVTADNIALTDITKDCIAGGATLINDANLERCGLDGIEADGPADLDSVQVDAAQQWALHLENGNDPHVHDLTVTDSGHFREFDTPVWIDAVNMQIGVGHIDGITGSGNILDAMTLQGTLVSDTTWVTPALSTTTVPLGYVAANLTVHDATLMLPAGAAVIGNSIILDGGELNAPQGARFFNVGVTPATFNIYGTDDELGHPPTVAMHGVTWDNTAPAYATKPAYAGGLTISSASGQGTIDVTDSELPGVTSSGVAITLTGDTVAGSATDWSTGHAISAAISITGGSAVIARTLSYGGVRVSNATLSGSCDSITGQPALAVTGTLPVTVTDSDLHRGGSAPPVPLLTTDASVDARRDWWEPAGGPQAGDIDHPELVNDTDYLDQRYPNPVATAAISDSNTAANGDFLPGQISATLTVDRLVNTSIPMQVFLHYDDADHLVNGAWIDEHTWQGTYNLAAEPHDGGGYLTASNGRGCVNDPSHNQIVTYNTYYPLRAAPSTTAQPASPSTGPQPPSAPAKLTMTLSGGRLIHGLRVASHGLTIAGGASGVSCVRLQQQIKKRNDWRTTHTSTCHAPRGGRLEPWALHLAPGSYRIRLTAQVIATPWQRVSATR